jgi:hypothetical protein
MAEADAAMQNLRAIRALTKPVGSRRVPAVPGIIYPLRRPDLSHQD